MDKLDLSGHKILIVEDVQFARQTLRKVLFGFGQPTLLEAKDGREAQAILNSEKDIDFVIADFKMPNVNGLELLKSIRCGQTKVPRPFPFAMLTGFSQEHLVDMALALDVNAFLIKPVTAESLSRRLTKMLEVARDTSWLKSAGDYGTVSVAAAGATEAPQSAAKQVKAKRPGRRRATSFYSAGKPAEFFEERDLAGLPEARHEKFKASDLAGHDLIRRASDLCGGTEWSIAPPVAATLEQLTGDVGGEGTQRLISVLDDMEGSGAISVDDVATLLTRPAPARAASAPPASSDPVLPADGEEVFVALASIPENAVLAQELHTQDGSLLLSVGTPLTGQVLAIVQHLDDLGLISLDAPFGDDGVGGGLFIRMSETPGAVSGEVVDSAVADLSAGMTVARDIYMTDGRLYMRAGTKLTDRFVSLLRDLEDLGRIDRKIWVVS